MGVSQEVSSEMATRGHKQGIVYLVHHTDNEPLLLDLVGLDGVVILQDFTWRKVSKLEMRDPIAVAYRSK